MMAFDRLVSLAVPLIRHNIDTDSIIPSREMRSTGKSGLAAGLFAPWRYLDADNRTPDPGFVLNEPRYLNAQIMVSGANFGCGSSREHAVWALAEYGIRCIIAESFAPIFYNNCVRNGILPVILRHNAIAAIAGQLVSVDLPGQTLGCDKQLWEFAIAVDAKEMLVEGYNPIDMTLKHRSAIANWRAHDRTERPWIYWEKAG